MGAAPVAFQPAIKGMAAGQAARVGDAREGGESLGGEVPEWPLIQRQLRDRTVAGEDEVKEAPVEGIKQPH
jgi:hypothetical protein